MARETVEQSAARKFLSSISTLDFDEVKFAFTVLTVASTAVQNRVLELLLTFVDSIVAEFETIGFPTDPDKVELCVKAKQIQDAMQHFR